MRRTASACEGFVEKESFLELRNSTLVPRILFRTSTVQYVLYVHFVLETTEREGPCRSDLSWRISEEKTTFVVWTRKCGTSQSNCREAPSEQREWPPFHS